MTLTDLRYIVALAETLHFGRAAEKCFVAQPTLSAAVKKLEQELNVMLFERDSSEVRITPVGAAIVVQARKVLGESARIRELAKAGQDPLASPLKLGVIYTIGPYLLPALIPQMRERAPHMPLVIREQYTTQLVAAVQEGELDVIVAALPLEAPGLNVLPLYDEPFRVVTPAAHSFAQRKQIDAAQLADEPMLLLGTGNCFRDQVLQVCPGLRERVIDSGELDPMSQLPRTLEGTSLETIRHMVASGIGITVLPSAAADPLVETNELLAVRRFRSPQPFRRIALAWRSTFPRQAAIDLLAQAIQACALPGVTALQAGQKWPALPPTSMCAT